MRFRMGFRLSMFQVIALYCLDFLAVWIHWHKKRWLRIRTHGMNEHVFFLQRTCSKASCLVFMWKFHEANKGNLLYKIFRAQGGRTMILLPRNQVQVFMFSTSRNGGIIAKTCSCTLDQVKTNDLLNLRNITHDTMNSIATGWYHWQKVQLNS